MTEELDFAKPEFGPEWVRSLCREAAVNRAAYRRENGLPEPEPWPKTFLGLPVVFVKELEANIEGDE